MPSRVRQAVPHWRTSPPACLQRSDPSLLRDVVGGLLVAHQSTREFAYERFVLKQVFRIESRLLRHAIGKVPVAARIGSERRESWPLDAPAAQVAIGTIGTAPLHQRLLFALARCLLVPVGDPLERAVRAAVERKLLRYADAQLSTYEDVMLRGEALIAAVVEGELTFPSLVDS